MSQVRFQADADLKQAIVTGVTRRQSKLNGMDESNYVYSSMRRSHLKDENW